MLGIVLFFCYIILCFSCIVLDYKNVFGCVKNKALKFLFSKKTLSGLLLIFLAFILSFKGIGVGNDTLNYYKYYDLCRNIKFADLFVSNTHFEVGFAVYTFFISNILHIPFSVYLFVNYLIMMFCIWYFINNYSDDVFFSILIFFCFTFFNFFITGFRQALSISICVLAASIILKKRNIVTSIGFFVLIFAATLIHESSIICSLIFFIPLFKMSERRFFCLCIITMIIYIFGAPIFELFYIIVGSNYPPFLFGAGLQMWLIFAMTIFSYFLGSNSICRDKIFDVISRKAKNNCSILFCINKNETIFGSLILLSFFGIWMTIIARYSSGIGRLNLFYNVFLISLIPNALSTLANKKMKFWIKTIICVCFVAFFVYYSVIPKNYHVLPYSFGWIV